METTPTNPFYQKGGMKNLLTKVDFSRPCYVILAEKPFPTCLIDPETGQPWHTYFKPEAERMVTILKKEDNVQCVVKTLVDTLVYLCKREGVKIVPPFTMQSISEQLMDAELKRKANEARQGKNKAKQKNKQRPITEPFSIESFNNN